MTLLALLALFGIAMVAAGPGALVATVALFAADHHTHRISLHRDAGHADILIAHASEHSDTGAAGLGPRDEHHGDHRVHLTSADETLARAELRSHLAAPSGLAVLVRALLVPPQVEAAPHVASTPGHAQLARLKRSVVLQV